MIRQSTARREFAAGLAEGMSGAAAARRAGYSSRTARSIAWRLRQHPEVVDERNRLERLRQDRHDALARAVEAAVADGDVPALLAAFAEQDRLAAEPMRS